MAIFEIHYQFTFDDQRDERIRVRLDDQSLLAVDEAAGEQPAWTALDYQQCAHCPLTPDDHEHCPVALSLARTMGAFDHVHSYEEVDLLVEMPERTTSARVPVQRAISSLLGLLFAASGCPYTDYMKPMARFHLPLSTEEDTIFRATGMYLIAQYFRKENGLGHELDFDGLMDIYRNLHEVNTGIAARIRSASRSDSSSNAVVLLDMFTHIMPFAVEDKLEELEPLFHAFALGSDGG